MAELIDKLREAVAERYAVQRELGRGGMATVFLAEDLKHRRSVAIKVLHEELAAQIGPERFVREIEIAARLQHPHILPLYDSGDAAGFLYYVMPLVEGESLRDRLNREHQLSQEDTVRITTEVAAALSYAHSRGVVHRDIKPENILLSGGTAVVADFGIARALDAAGENQLTQTGTIIGTPAYMSTEQATGSLEIDGRSDQYSLACVTYEMLVGQPPFTGPTAQAIIARHSLDMVSPPSIVRGTIPEPMEDAILRALSKVPADRFATTALFAEALALPGTASGIRRQTAARGLRPTVPRRWARPAAAAGAVALLLLGVWVAAGWIRANRSGGPEAAGLDPHRVAVLYFQHRGDSAQTQYLADGLTEALIHELSEVKALEVTSANGVRPYRNTAVAPDSVGRALRTGTIVQGTVTEVGGRLRLDVALVDGTTGDETKSTRLETPRAELFALQDTLAKAVSAFLRQAIGDEIEVRETRAGTRDVRAWELVLEAEEAKKGEEALVAKGDVANASRELARADSLLARASARDARWTTPIVNRGWLAWEQRRIAGLDKGPASEWSARGLEFAAAALQIRPDSEALHLRGTMRYIRFLLNLDPAPYTAEQLLNAAEQDLRAGGESRSNPRRASALALLSHLLMHRSQTAEGKLAALHAYEADEYLQEASQVLYRLYSASLDLDDAAEATKWCQQGQRRFPNEWAFTECQISMFALRGSKPDIPKLWRLVDQYAAMFPSNLQDYRRRRGQMFLAMVLASAGRADSARNVALRARADANVDPSRDLVYLEVALRSILGDRDEAIRLLTLYLATNPQERASLANDHTWWFAQVRTDPRFQALVRTDP
ncbi:MAG TPA: serine/threonine-protein kinase [Gemmatimonadales bacterium]|nr:serine/threonine-protein kinase [Gemmatimonadales bacterium]